MEVVINLKFDEEFKYGVMFGFFEFLCGVVVRCLIFIEGVKKVGMKCKIFDM